MRRSLAALLVLAVFAVSAVSASRTEAQTRPAWPSVEAQLARDHVPAGSALEALIRANQDFSRLPAEEAQETGVPPWLRVLWRKSHPAGGYPWILYELHEWLVLHPDLKPTAPKVASPRQAFFTNGSNNNLRIASSPTSVRDESDVRINFNNPAQIVGASNNVASGPQAQFYSTDGGLTWGQTFLPLLNADVFHGDPAVDWTSDGTAWATTLGITLSPMNVEVRAYKSTDHGATWAFDYTVSNGQTDTDKEMLWADHSASSPYKDNLYVLWSHGGGMWMNRRISTGWTSGLVQLNGGETTGMTQGADIKSNGAGDVFAFWPSSGNHRLLVAKSTNGGASFGAPLILATTYAANESSQSAQPGVPAQNVRKVVLQISAGAYRSGSKNFVYATWMDLTGAPGCTASANAPGGNPSSDCKTRVWFSRSTDGGATWGAPVMLNNQPSRNDQFNPRLAVDESSGLLAVTYYDTVNDPSRVKTDVFYQSSYDNGVTWSSPFKVTTAETDESGAPTTANNIQYGEYNGLSGYAGNFFPTWTDRRGTTANEQIWGAALRDVNQPPTASFTFRCNLLACTFDAGGSTDDQGIVDYFWNFGDLATGSGLSPTHAYAASGRYTVTLTVTDGAGQFASVSRSVFASGDALTANESYFSLPPCRLLDTRGGSPLADGGSRLVTAAGACGVPATAKAISVVVTAVSPTGSGKLALFSGDQTYAPNVTGSALNFAPATSPRSNGDLVKVAANGTIGVGATVAGSPGSVHALLDVDGYFSTDATPAPGAVGPLGYQPVTNCRLADTRPSSPLVAGTQRTFTAQGVCGIPAGAAVASVRVGVSSPATGGGFTLYPSSLGTPPGTTSLNFVAGIGVLRNEARVPLAGTTPDFSALYTTTGAVGSTAFAFFDTDGYFQSGAPLKYHPITPCRAVDTGDPNNGAPALSNGTTRTFQIQGNCGVPVGAVAAFVRLVAGGPTASGDLTAYAANVARPAVSTIKFDAGEPNLSLGTIVPLASVSPGAADLAIFANLPPSGTTALAIDVHGYFTN